MNTDPPWMQTTKFMRSLLLQNILVRVTTVKCYLPSKVGSVSEGIQAQLTFAITSATKKVTK